MPSSSDRTERLFLAVRQQLKQMHVDVVESARGLDGDFMVLELERLHPDLRGTTLTRRKNLDVARATLRLGGDAGRARLTLDADWRVREFNELVLTTTALLRDRGQRADGSPPTVSSWTVEGSEFGWTFFRRVLPTLDVLHDLPCEIRFQDKRLVADVSLVNEGRARASVAALVSLWRAARPVKARGSDARMRRPKEKKKKRPRALASDGEVARLTAAMVEATSPYGGQVERVRDTIAARVSLAGHVAEDLRGELVAGFSTLRSRVHEVGLRATLVIPTNSHQLSLTPQRGLRGFLASLRDDRVGDDEIDRAFVIRLGTAAPELVRSLRAPLLRVAPRGASVHWTRERIVLHLDELRPLGSGLVADVGAALALWREAARFSAGLS